MIKFSKYLNEVIDLNNDYTSIDTEQFFRYAYELYLAQTDDDPKKSFEEATPFLFKKYSYTTKAFKHKDFVILYGKSPVRNRYEVHFWDVVAKQTNGLTGKNILSIFGVVMDIIIYKHLSVRNDDLYIVFDDDIKRGVVYTDIITRMLDKQGLSDKFKVNINTDNIAISKKSEV